jgi:hypothetical protein
VAGRVAASPGCGVCVPPRCSAADEARPWEAPAELLDQFTDNVEEQREAGQPQQGGRSAEALPIIQDTLATTTDPTTRAYTLVQRFGALVDPGVVACP